MITLRLIPGALAAATLACASTSPRVHPEDASAAEHRALARADAELSNEHWSEVDSTEHDVIPEGVHRPLLTHPDFHLSAWAIHAEHARQHLAAAKALEHSEAEACVSVPPADRAACPLAGFSTGRLIEDGVLLVPADPARLDALYARVRCHVAFARTRGSEGMDGCPLYVKGARVRRVGGAVEISAEDQQAARAIQQRAQAEAR